MARRRGFFRRVLDRIVSPFRGTARVERRPPPARPAPPAEPSYSYSAPVDTGATGETGVTLAGYYSGGRVNKDEWVNTETRPGDGIPISEVDDDIRRACEDSPVITFAITRGGVTIWRSFLGGTDDLESVVEYILEQYGGDFA